MVAFSLSSLIGSSCFFPQLDYILSSLFRMLYSIWINTQNAVRTYIAFDFASDVIYCLTTLLTLSTSNNTRNHPITRTMGFTLPHSQALPHTNKNSEKGGEPGIFCHVRRSQLIECGQTKLQVIYYLIPVCVAPSSKCFTADRVIMSPRSI